MPVTRLVFHVCWSCFPFDLGKGGGGVPGGVLDGDSGQGFDALSRGGRHGKHTLLGLGPKFKPPQFVHGGVGGGVHGSDPQLGGGGRDADRVSGVTVGGRIILNFISLFSIDFSSPIE